MKVVLIWLNDALLDPDKVLPHIRYLGASTNHHQASVLMLEPSSKSTIGRAMTARFFSCAGLPAGNVPGVAKI